MAEYIFSVTLVFPHLPDNYLIRAEKEAFRIAHAALLENSTWTTPALARVRYEFYLSTEHELPTCFLVSRCLPWLHGIQRAGLLASCSGLSLWIGSASLMKAKHDQTRLIIEPRQ